MSPAAILILLSVLCHLHSGLLAASQTLQNCPILRANSNTFADLKAYGKSLRDCGRLSEATVVFRETVQQARESNNKKNEADALMLLGSAEILNFQYRAALTSYQTGRDIAEIIHNDSLTARASGSIATIYIQLGDFAAAEGESQRAISLLKRLTNPDAEDGRRLQRALVNHATVCFELKKDAQGYRDYDQGLTMATNDQERAYILNERGVALMRGNRLEEASATFQNTMELCRRSRDVSGLVAIEDEHLAELELRKSNPDFHTALSFIDKAFAEHSPIFDASPQYYPIHIRAKILLGLGRKSNALAEFMRAVNAANQWRLGALPGDATSTQTVANLQQVYSDYAQLAAEISLERGDKALAFNALEVLAENRATSLREQLAAAFGSNGSLPAEYYSKIAELQIAQAAVTLGRNTSEDQAKLLQIQLELSNLENKIGINSVKPRILREKIPRRNSLRDIQHALSGDQVLLSITLGKSRSYMWAVTAGNVNLLKLPGEGEITSKAELFASAVRLGQDISASSAAMSRALFSGLPPDVWNRSDWMMVADGPLLTGIPFSALQSLAPGHTGRPLIERTTLRFLPSELLIANRKKTKLAQTFVGVGDPIYNQADPRLNGLRLADAKTVSNGVTLARLVGSDKELRSDTAPAFCILRFMWSALLINRSRPRWHSV